MKGPKRNMRDVLAPTWTYILLSVLTISSGAHPGDSRARPSSTLAERGVCEVTDLEFSVGSHRLKVHGSAESTEPCKKIGPSWGLVEDDRKVDLDSLLCDQVFEEGYYFKFGERQRPGAFLRDVAIPLFSALHDETLPSNKDDQGVLLPAIEQADNEVIDWDTDFFLEPFLLKNQLIQAIARGCSVLPLDKRLSAVNKTLCFRKAYFGVPQLNNKEAVNAVPSFIERVKETLAIHDAKPNLKEQLRIGLALPVSHVTTNALTPDDKSMISKKISSFAKAVNVDYSTLSLKEQVLQTQQLDVLLVAGEDATSLSGALYLPPWGVVVRLLTRSDGQKQDPLQKLLESRGVLLTAATYQGSGRSLNDVPSSRNSAISNIEETLRKAVAIVQHNLQKL